MKFKVSIQPAAYETIRQAVNRVFKIIPLEVRGKRVLVKPNVLRSSDAVDGIVTHPAVVAAVVEALEAMGPAELVVGDNPGVVSYQTRRAFVAPACWRLPGAIIATSETTL